MRYQKVNHRVPLHTEKQVWDHYYSSNDKERLWNIINPMHPHTTRIYEFREQRINDKVKNKNYEYFFECTYDPTGKKLGYIHIHREEKPITPKRWVFQVLGPKNRYYYVSHYDSMKYRKEMKKYKDGKIKSRPNGNKRCNLEGKAYHIRS